MVDSGAGSPRYAVRAGHHPSSVALQDRLLGSTEVGGSPCNHQTPGATNGKRAVITDCLTATESPLIRSREENVGHCLGGAVAIDKGGHVALRPHGQARRVPGVEGKRAEDGAGMGDQGAAQGVLGMPGRGIRGMSLRALVCLGDPQPPEAGEAGGEDAQEAFVWIVSILPPLDYQCGGGGTQQQDPGDQVGSQGLPPLQELSEKDPVLLRPTVDATENRPLNPPKNFDLVR